MDLKKYQVFVSSTFNDLVDVRRSVMDAVQLMNHFAVGMEQFSADDDEQWQVIRETLGQTDYYICVIGHRYGSLSSDGKSFTEKEWDHARELGIPIMSFIRDRNFATTPQQREDDPEMTRRLDAFIAKAKTDKMVDFWKEPNELVQKAITSLYKAFSRKPRSGWIRSESGQVAEQLATLVDENRTLRNQVEKLTSEVKHTKPVLAIKLNGKLALDLKFVGDSDLNLTQEPYLPPLDWESVSDYLKPYLSEEEITQYNAKLTALEDLSAKIAEIQRLQRIKFTAYRLNISLGNAGSAKARQVYCDLVFPESVVVMKKDDWMEVKIPKLVLPKNPIGVAEAKRTRAQVNPFGYPRAADMLSAGFPEISIGSQLIRHVAPQTRSLRVEGNRVSVWIEDLMHTREQIFSGVVIIPLEEGTFTITGTIICEEFEAPQPYQFPLTTTAGTRTDLRAVELLSEE